MKDGFLLTAGNKEYFLVTSTKKKTEKIIKSMIDNVGRHRNCCPETIERAKQDKYTIDDFRRRIDLATLQERHTENGTRYFVIAGKNFQAAFPEADFSNDVVVFEA